MTSISSRPARGQSYSASPAPSFSIFSSATKSLPFNTRQRNWRRKWPVAGPWVINASPVILLAKVGLMEQVATLASPLVVPEPVAAEIPRLTGEDAATRWMRSAGKEFVRPPAMETPELSGTQIGDGERAVISWAVAHREFTAGLDDFEARDRKST